MSLDLKIVLSTVRLSLFLAASPIFFMSITTKAWSSILISLLNPKTENLIMSLRNDIVGFWFGDWRIEFKLLWYYIVFWDFQEFPFLAISFPIHSHIKNHI